MTLGYPKKDYMFHEVEATRVGRFKMWIHYDVLRHWVYPLLPMSIRQGVYESVRRWIYGPNANNEDLRAVLEEAFAAMQKYAPRQAQATGG